MFAAKAKCRRHIIKFHKDTPAGIDTKHIRNKLYIPADIPPLRLGNVAERMSKEQRKREAQQAREALVKHNQNHPVLTEVVNRDEEIQFIDGQWFKLTKGVLGGKSRLVPYKKKSSFQLLCELYKY